MKQDTIEKLEDLAKLVAYGAEWYSGGDTCPTYATGGAETLAHVVACYFAQNFGNEFPEVEEGVETGYIRDVLKLDKRPATARVYFARLKRALLAFA